MHKVWLVAALAACALAAPAAASVTVSPGYYMDSKGAQVITTASGAAVKQAMVMCPSASATITGKSIKVSSSTGKFSYSGKFRYMGGLIDATLTGTFSPSRLQIRFHTTASDVGCPAIVSYLRYYGRHPRG
ncbi:MAG TPA: hypothetical protein VHB30_13855 [Solirubrobacteraceae bacterium]|jgi:hypothetical protein|nr:hypothetical protein [Solirubrobacteraceae bacterium]